MKIPLLLRQGLIIYKIQPHRWKKFGENLISDNQSNVQFSTMNVCYFDSNYISVINEIRGYSPRYMNYPNTFNWDRKLKQRLLIKDIVTDPELFIEAVIYEAVMQLGISGEDIFDNGEEWSWETIVDLIKESEYYQIVLDYLMSDRMDPLVLSVDDENISLYWNLTPEGIALQYYEEYYHQTIMIPYKNHQDLFVYVYDDSDAFMTELYNCFDTDEDSVPDIVEAFFSKSYSDSRYSFELRINDQEFEVDEISYKSDTSRHRTYYAKTSDQKKYLLISVQDDTVDEYVMHLIGFENGYPQYLGSQNIVDSSRVYSDDSLASYTDVFYPYSERIAYKVDGYSDTFRLNVNELVEVILEQKLT